MTIHAPNGSQSMNSTHRTPADPSGPPDVAAPSPAKVSWLAKLGPGLITGAADDDPSGIATYSQAGAQFGFGMLWTVLLTYPLMVGIQVISAKIGRVSGHGLATNIRRHYPAWLLYAIVGLLLVANTINIAADVAAMGQALRLLAGGPAQLYALGFGLLSLLLQVFIPYRNYVRILKWLTVALLAYVATVLVVRVPWLTVLHDTLLPPLSWKAAYLTTVVAVFGTTISPYLFFWQASQEVEDMQADPHALALKRAPHQVSANFNRIKADTVIGMGFSNLVAFCIILTTAVTLHAHGIADESMSVMPCACSVTASPTSIRRRRRRRRCGRSPASSPSCCSAWASSAPACWPYRCWPARPRMRWPAPSAGPAAWRRSRRRRKNSMPSSPARPWSAPRCASRLSIRSRRCTGAPSSTA